MPKKNILGIIYVSAWVLIWGTIGSIVDFPLLQSELYNPGSLGQIITFTITGIVSVILGILLFPILLGDVSD